MPKDDKYHNNMKEKFLNSLNNYTSKDDWLEPNDYEFMNELEKALSNKSPFKIANGNVHTFSDKSIIDEINNVTKNLPKRKTTIIYENHDVAFTILSELLPSIVQNFDIILLTDNDAEKYLKKIVEGISDNKDLALEYLKHQNHKTLFKYGFEAKIVSASPTQSPELFNGIKKIFDNLKNAPHYTDKPEGI